MDVILAFCTVHLWAHEVLHADRLVLRTLLVTQLIREMLSELLWVEILGALFRRGARTRRGVLHLLSF